jgi:hypothetical protein
MLARPLVLICCVVLMVALAASCGPFETVPLPPNEGKIKVTEVSLGSVAGANKDDLVLMVSRDQAHIAFRVKCEGGEVASIDGKEGPVYDQIVDYIQFSSDCKRTVYVGRRGQSQYVVVDGAEGPAYEPFADAQPTFSPDSKRLAFWGRRGDRIYRVIDGVEGTPYVKMNQQEFSGFSPDSRRYAYSAQRDDGKWVMVVDGREGAPYDSIWGRSPFSENSEHVFYSAWRDKVSYVVIDGKEVFQPTEADGESGSSTTFSPDGKRFLYKVTTFADKQVKVVVDGVAGKAYDDDIATDPRFSPDSQHVAYTATISKQQCAVVDGQEGPLFDRIVWSPRFSPDGKHVAYVGRRGAKHIVVLDGVEQGEFYDAACPEFSPDSQHLAYAVSPLKGPTTVMLDGKASATCEYAEYWRTDIYFSPDSQRTLYHLNGAWCGHHIIIDGADDRKYQMADTSSYAGVSRTPFSPDSKHVAYWATNGKDGWRIFVDGSYTEDLGEPLNSTKIIFDGPTKLHGLAQRGNEIIRVEIEILP